MLAAGCGAAAGFAYIRLAPLRLFATFLSPALVVVPAAFLLTPGIAGLLAAADEESALDVAFGATPPVVIVIFDQLPLISLLDADGRIDPALYPHFAALASESTWFRNASAVAEYTSFALPAILTGNYPERGRLPVAADYPENLFTLLGGRYRLHVQEPLTELCPAALCPPRRAPPTARLAGILSDLAVVYLAVILPDDLAARLPPVETTGHCVRESPGRSTSGRYLGLQLVPMPPFPGRSFFLQLVAVNGTGPDVGHPMKRLPAEHQPMSTLDQQLLYEASVAGRERKPIRDLLTNLNIQEMPGRDWHHDLCPWIPPAPVEVVLTRPVIVQPERRMIRERPFLVACGFNHAPAMATQRLCRAGQEMAHTRNPEAAADWHRCLHRGQIRTRNGWRLNSDF